MKKHPRLHIPAPSGLSNPPAANYPAMASDPGNASVEPSPLNRKFMVPPQPGNSPRTPDAFNSVPFADLPLYIPNVRIPYIGYDGALNIAATEVHKELGVLFVLLPYLDRAAFDLLQLFYGDSLNPVDSYTLNQDDIDNDRSIPMYVPPNRIIQGPVNPVFVRATRFGGGTAETQHLHLFIDLVRPAGKNPIASTVQNENLAKPEFPQALIDFGVGQGDIGVPIPVRIKRYPVNTSSPTDTFRKVRDRIRLSIGGKIIAHSVTEGEADGTGDIVIWINTSDWIAIGTGSHVCEYEVIDEAGNHSDGWSPAQILDVLLEDGSEPLLPPAFVQEAPENILDHDTLVGDAHIFIFISGNGYALGDIIRVTVNGRTVEGEPLVTRYDSPPLTSTTAFYLTVVLPNADVKALVGGRFQLRYKRIRSGVPDRYSHSNIVYVIGTELPVGLAPPYVIEAGGTDTLEPQELFFNAVIPKYVGQNYFDLVTLILVGAYANGTPYYREYDDIAGEGDGLRLIHNGPNGDIAKLEGGTLRLYSLVENEHGLRPSRDRLYNVGQPTASLAEPLVLEAPKPAYQFDPSVSLDNANVRVLPDVDIKDGDTVRLYALGNAQGGTPSILPFPVTAFWEGRTLPFTLPRANVILNTAMRIYYARERENAPTRFSHEVRMGVGAKLDVPAPRVLEATVTGHDRALLNPRHVLTPPVVTIQVISDKFPPSADIKVFITGKSGIGMPDIPAKSAHPEPGTNYVSFTVPNTFVAAYLGEHCKVYYNLIEVGKTTKSDDLELSVGAFTQDELDLVSIPQAPGNVIIGNEGNEVEIAKWPFISTTQEVFIDLESATNHALRTGRKVSSAEMAAGKTKDLIPVSYLQTLSSSDEIIIKARASLDGSGNEFSAIEFKPVIYSFARQPEIIETIPVGKWPSEMAITPDSRKLYVLNNGSSSTTVINTQTQTVETTLVSSGSYGIDISKDGTRLYTGRHVYLSVERINIYSTVYDNQISVINTHQDLWPQSVFASNDNTKLYVSTAQSTFDVYSLPSNTFIKSVNPRIRPHTIYSNTEKTLMYIQPLGTAGSVNYYLRFDQGSDSFLSNTPYLSGDPKGIAFHGSRQRAYYVTANTIGILNPQLNTLMGELVIFSSASGIACHPALNRAYVADRAENTLTVIDTSTDSLKVVQTITGFNGPTGVLASPDGKFIYVINYGADAVSVVSVS